ncbi:SpoIIE family protein phosphatase [Lignipirellula cremea]|uniref:Phosphoserine phosphatase RsbP n=1 Tax=Lignipirellula cremea TaxID=2528010 RepID=A0A518DS74_9BACT|nr:SpoIIE family protein phosphatase [Lignipirellula cremea]QDU94692.1 Phosphoserine phosphatase RsbP [Lignipirellula cremea]
MATIFVVQGKRKGDKREVFGREFTIGRHPSCDLELAETTVSRRHARIARRPDGFYLEDLGSQHGTWLNDQRVERPTRLGDLDIVKISDVLLEFREVDYDVLPHEPNLEEETGSSIITMLDAGACEALSEVNLHRKLRALLDITRHLGSTLDLDKLFPEVLSSIFEIFPQAQRGYVLMVEPGGEKLHCRASKLRGDDAEAAAPISRTIARRVIRESKAVLSADAVSDERFMGSESVASLRIRSVVSAPLIGSGNTPLGLIHIDTMSRRERFSAGDLEVLVNVANLVARVLELLALHQTQLQFDRRERDIRTARQVQLHFLPREAPQLPEYDLCHYYQAAEGVGGDYFDYVPLPDGRWAIAVGDIAGKGVSAALLMARICSEVRFSLLTSPTPAEAANRLNLKISELVYNSRFVTLALCILDPVRHEVTIVNAGHMPPLMRLASGEVLSLGQAESGPPLGVLTEQKYEQIIVPLAEGDILLLYTDGLNESLNHNREMFGCDRIEEFLARAPSADAVIDSLLTELSRFTKAEPQTDDLCMLSLSRQTRLQEHDTIADDDL